MKPGKGIALACALLAAVPFPVYAAEVDSLTDRRVRLSNSMARMNARVNDFIHTGVARANATDTACDEEELYRQIRHAISFPFIGHAIAEDLNVADDLDRRRVPLDDSIYRDLGLLDAISVHLKDLSALIRMGDDLVGVDKFGHFFVEGWKYFDIAYLDGGGTEAAMEWGEHSERTYFGLYTTGIYSYADLAANFEGMRFWLRVLGQEEDPLNKGSFYNRPYVVCGKRLWGQKPHWRVLRRVDLSRYVNGAWDEGVNCLEYRNAQITGLIRDRVKAQEVNDGADYDCPMRPDECAAARKRYGAYAQRLLHPHCLDAAPRPRPWWKFW